MSITSFIPSVWETALLTAWRGVSVANVITTAPTRIEGGKAIFNSVTGGTVKDYSGTISYDDVATQPVELTYDQKKYWAVKLDDVDKIQAAGPVLNALANEKALDLKEAVDKDLLAEMAKIPTSGNKQLIGTTGAKTSITTPSQAYDLIVDLGTILSKNKTPIAGRFVIASAEYVNMMAKDPRFADNFNVLPNGILQGATINGMTIIQCEEVPANTVLAVHKSAFGYGEELNETEALRLENSFSDAVRGLAVYGRVALRTKGIAGLLYQIGAAA